MRSLKGFFMQKNGAKFSSWGLGRQKPRKPMKTPRATPHPSEIPITNTDPPRAQEAWPARLSAPDARGILDSTELA